VYAHPDLVVRLHAAREVELLRAAEVHRQARAASARCVRPALITCFRRRVGWWLVEQGLHLIGSQAPPVTP
jgi:hypothetical protein